MGIFSITLINACTGILFIRNIIVNIGGMDIKIPGRWGANVRERGRFHAREPSVLDHKQFYVYREEREVPPILKKGGTDSGRSCITSPVLQQLQISAVVKVLMWNLK